MSSRAVRRLLKEREVLSQQQQQQRQPSNNDQVEQEEEEDAEEEQEITSTAPKKNLFALLGGDDNDNNDDDDDDDDNDDDGDRNNGNDDAAAAQDKDQGESKDDEKPIQKEPRNTLPSPQTHRQSSKKKSAKKQNQKRAPAKNSKDRGNDDEEDLDAVLSELNAKYGDIGLSSDASERITQSAEQQDKQLAAKQLFAIETRKLDGDAEMRNMFGRIATEETRNKRYVKTKRRTVLATARENWPPLARLGLSMELVQSQEDIRQFAFVHSQEYVQIQGMFFECVNSHDPQTIANLLHIYPYHIDSLLQLSEACKHNGDIAMASELIERALFSFERAFHPLFNVATGCCRLSYDRIENRALFLCIRRHIEYLTRRGCWQTAFEFQKLLISLDPITDPMCSELSLDFLALKAGGAALHWYKTFWEIQQGELQVLPNAAYSIALIEWELETQQSKPHDRSSELLRQAIAQFPGVVVALCDKMTMMHAISNNPALFSRDVNAPESVLEILIDFYVERAHTIWKVPETLQWFLSQVSIVSQDSQTQPQPDYVSAGKQFAMENYALEEPIPLNLQRAMFLSDNHLFISRLPKTTVQSGILAYDPIPPESSLPSVYDKMRPQPRLSASGDPLQNMLQWLGQFDFGIGDLARRVAAEVERRQRGEPHPENEPVDEEAVQEADRLDRVMNGELDQQPAQGEGGIMGLLRTIFFGQNQHDGEGDDDDDDEDNDEDGGDHHVVDDGNAQASAHDVNEDPDDQ